jgi:hypothetical protein
MKKTYLIILMILLTLFICPTHTVVDASAEKEIDIYLIAGQSNAVGYTIVDENGKADLNQMDPRFTSGFDKVLYYGCSNVNVGAKLPTMTVQTTKIGLGKDNNCIGPELGMAQYFSNLSTNQVGIIKYASGASSIYDDYKSTQNSQRGNWYSPSVEKAIGIPAGNTSISGNCYRVFLEVVKEGLKAYKDLGYKPVIKGLAWMQGEAESQSKEYSAKYATLLKALISDIRTELSKETGQDLSTMHVVVAKIPSHYKPTNPSYTDVVREQQQFVADNDAFITTIDNDSFELPGTDNHHYNWADMLLLGYNFAEAFYNKANVKTNTIRFVCNDGGQSLVTSMMAETGSYVENTLTPYRGFEISSSSIKFLDPEGNEVNVRSYNSGNYLQFQVPDTDLVVQINFSVIPQFEVEMKSENGFIYRTNSTRNPYRDETVTFTFKPNEGYELSGVKLNGEVIDLSNLSDGDVYKSYSVKVTEDIELEAIYSKIEINNNDSNLDENQESELKFFNGNVATAIIISCSVLALCAAGVVALVVLKKKNKNSRG